MRFVFNERKAAEAAAFLLEKRGGRMEYFVLIKLLYLADRQALADNGFPITGDRWVSMPHGPVLSRILDTIHYGARTETGPASPWFEYVSEPRGYEVELRKGPPADGELSDYDVTTLADVFDRYGGMDKWTLRDLTHRLPEYTDPDGSVLQIEPEAVLRAAGASDGTIRAISEDAEAVWSLRRALQPQ
ncbi:MAG: Panacea domain-containing protein [Candidatus Dormibacteria bacterium]